MSKDFALAWECPHLTVEEHVTLGPDRVSLQTTQPIGNATTVRVLANDDTWIPQSGLYAAAQLFSTLAGPFDLTEGQDVLTVETSRSSETITFGVFGTQRFTASQVIQRMLQMGFSAALVEEANAHLVFTDTATVGVNSFIRVSGSAASSLGFGAEGVNSSQRGARGREIYPGWLLVKRALDGTFRFPQFLKPIKGHPNFKVTYAAPGRSCKRCGGSFVENDTRFDSTGQGIFVQNEDLLQQAAAKIVLTVLGSNPYHNWYGSRIKDRIGSKAIGNVASLISEDVRKSLVRLQDAQKSQAEYQQVTSKERLYAVTGVRTQAHAQDPTTFLVDVTLQNASGEPVSISRVFTVPTVVALLGSNGLFLGTEAAGLTAEAQRRMFPGGRTIIPPGSK